MVINPIPLKVYHFLRLFLPAPPSSTRLLGDVFFPIRLPQPSLNTDIQRLILALLHPSINSEQDALDTQVQVCRYSPSGVDVIHRPIWEVILQPPEVVQAGLVLRYSTLCVP